MGDHVGLVDPGEALDRRAVEAHALREGGLELGRGDRDRLQEAEHVGEPHPDEPDVALFDRPQHELGLLVHPAQSAVQVVTDAITGQSQTAGDPPRIRLEPCRTCASPWPRSTPTVGDISANADLVLEWAQRATEAGAHLVVFPEMVLTGYPVEDLVLRRSFVEASRTSIGRLAQRLDAAGLGEMVAVVGYLDRTDEPESPPWRASAERRRGAPSAAQVVATYAKHHLPNYGVFDEYRYFEPGNELHVVRIRGVDVALAICEDLWQDGGPSPPPGEAEAGLLAVINACPYERDKDDVRGGLVVPAGPRGGLPPRVRQPGRRPGRAGLRRRLHDQRRRRATITVRALQFVEELVVADLELPAARAPMITERAEDTVPANPVRAG